MDCSVDGINATYLTYPWNSRTNTAVCKFRLFWSSLTVRLDESWLSSNPSVDLTILFEARPFNLCVDRSDG